MERWHALLADTQIRCLCRAVEGRMYAYAAAVKSIPKSWPIQGHPAVPGIGSVTTRVSAMYREWHGLRTQNVCPPTERPQQTGLGTGGGLGGQGAYRHSMMFPTKHLPRSGLRNAKKLI